jgi:BirA family biotin operon repressor/biotin-[acetyl-CoA-carboxylase] ligase
VIGIGLNVGTAQEDFPDELRDSATSVMIESGSDPGTEAVLDAVLGGLEHWLGQKPDAVIDAWRERDVLLGRPVRWNGGEGTAAGLDEGGSLVVETESGRVALDAGEVHLLR